MSVALNLDVAMQMSSVLWSLGAGARAALRAWQSVCVGRSRGGAGALSV